MAIIAPSARSHLYDIAASFEFQRRETLQVIDVIPSSYKDRACSGPAADEVTAGCTLQ
jgi:hypothetical protein